MITSRRSLLRAAGLTAGATLTGVTLAGCGSDSKTDRKIGANLEEIAKLAKEEGEVRLIAYPETWANYKGHFAEFEKKWGVKVVVDSPDASSAEELQAVQNLKGQETQPDVLDLGYSFTTPAEQQGLIEAYKPSNFDSVPENLKHPEGLWVGAYYGVLTLAVNTDKAEVPKTFADLKDPKYKGMVAMPGDPRQGASSIATVFAAALANGGSLDNISPGIDYFAELAEMGNLVAVADSGAALTNGQAALVFDWNYNWLGRTEQLKKDGINFETVVLTDGVYGNYYAQPITVNSPQPNAGRLWIDWLTSDEGSEQYALGGAIPARFNELVEAGKLSDAALANLPDPEVVATINFPTVEQGDAANKVLATEWATKVKI